VVRWKGSIGLDSGIELNSVPPSPDESNGMVMYDGQLRTATNDNASLWPGPGVPTRAQCDERAKTHSEGSFYSFITIHRGDYLCVITWYGYSARLHITKVGSTTEADVVIWEKTDESS
jgi:hypothetical protein